jgi:hypothetical protein
LGKNKLEIKSQHAIKVLLILKDAKMQKALLFLGLFFCTVFGEMCGKESSFDSVEGDSCLSVQKAVNPPSKPIYKFLLITGCARSGTTYITEVLRHCGLNVLHEDNGEDGIVSWLMAARDFATPYGPAYYNFRFKHIFHQVREPLKSMSSFTTEAQQAWKFVMKHTPQIKAKDPMIVKCAKYWYYWNKRAEAKAEWTYRVEDMETALVEMGHRLGFYLDPEAIKKVDTLINHRSRQVNYTWDEVKGNLSPEMYQKLIDLARRYGYYAPD